MKNVKSIVKATGVYRSIGGTLFPPPPKYLHGVGRYLGIPEDVSGVDEQR